MSGIFGKRVMVVEDEMIIALDIEHALHEAGCILVGTFSRVAKALEGMKDMTIDAALLDVNVANEKVFPVAYALEERGVPFLFLTGYGELALPPDRPNWQACTKPFRSDHLIEQLELKLGF